MPEDEPGRKTVEEIAIEVRDKYKAVWDKFVALHEKDPGVAGIFAPDPAEITRSKRSDDSEERRMNERFSRMLMDDIRAAGIYSLIDQIPAASPWSEPTYFPIDQPGAASPAFGALRQTARICVGRMRLARES